MKHDTIIVGAGASGIIAALTAKDMGKDVALIEGNDRIGKKILVTGNGRCNISNKCINLNRYHSDNDSFFKFALTNFNAYDTETFFNSIGMQLITLEDDKMYPMSLQASSVLDILKMALEEREIPIYLNSKVTDIKKIKDDFNVECTSGDIFKCKKLIIACGGKSASKTGSDGSGYSLAKKLGHKVIEPFPALVQLKLNYKNLKALSGIKFDGFAEIIVDGTPLQKEFGEILFTDYGISGPPILQLSRLATSCLMKNKNTSLTIDLIPSKSKKELMDFLENHWGTFSYRSVFSSFIGIINKKLIPILLKEADVIDIHKPCYELSWKEKSNIYSLLKEWKFEVVGNNSFNNSQVTAGGIDTKNINNSSMESTLVKNLYFCGEILDVDGDCGGFNLQWAWSSGYLAGKS